MRTWLWEPTCNVRCRTLHVAWYHEPYAAAPSEPAIAVGSSDSSVRITVAL